MTTLILSILVAFSGSGRTASIQYVDVIEINHCMGVDYKGEYKEQYTQLIFRRWNPEYRRHDIAAWMMVRNPEDIPQKIGDDYEVKYREFGSGKMLTVRSKILNETETDYDPERVEQKLLPTHRRVGLIGGGQSYRVIVVDHGSQ